MRNGFRLLAILCFAAASKCRLTDLRSSAIFNQMVNDVRPLDLVFSALSDPTRRAMLERLRKGELTVGSLAEPFDMSLPAISKHVKILENAGLVSRAVDGREHYCRLSPKALQNAAAYLDHYRTFWNQRLDSLARFLEPPKRSRSRRKRNG